MTRDLCVKHLKRMRAVVTALVAALIVSAAPWAPYSSRAATIDPVNHWPFDEVGGALALDVAGGLSGSFIGGTSRIDDGFAGRAVRFDGSDDRLSIADESRLRSDVITLSAWVRADQANPPADGAIILEKGDLDCLGGAYGILVDGNFVRLRFRAAWNLGYDEITVPAEFATASAPLWDGAWHHVAFMVYSGAWGAIQLYMDGHYAGGRTYSDVTPAGIAHSGLDVATLSVGGPAASCGRPAFRGDVDDLRIYDRYLPRGELGALEPTVPVTMTFGTLPAMTVGEFPMIGLTLSPSPWEGTVETVFRDVAGTEHLLGRTDHWLYAPPSTPMQLVLYPEIGGIGTLVSRYTGSAPWLSAEVSAPITIQRAMTWTSVNFQVRPMSNAPLRVGAIVNPVPNIRASGTVDLYELVGQHEVFVGSATLEQPVGSILSTYEFVLPPAAAGPHDFVAYYGGDLSFLPSTGRNTVEVLQSIEVGTVLINDGDSVTADPIVTVIAPANGAVGMQITPDPAIDVPPITYAPTQTTWIAAPWFGNDVDGPHSMFVRWADASSTWTDWVSDSIILDRVAPTGSITLAGGRLTVESSEVDVAVPATDAWSPITTVALSNDGSTWTSMPYAPTLNWLLTGGSGTRTVWAKWRDQAGNWSSPASDPINVSYTAGSVVRQAGANRYATAAAISAGAFSPGVSVAYVALGTNFPDALAAAAAAGHLDGPLLLVTTSTIPIETAAELTRLRPGRIVVVGGPAVVSDGVLDALRPY